MSHWQGAQWVLATTWVILTLVPILVRVSGMTLVQRDGTRDRASFSDFFHRQFVLATNRAALCFVLWWGGFW